MTKSIRFLCFSVLIVSGLSSSAQKAVKADDIARQSTEYIKVSKDIADLTSQLAIARNNLSGYQKALKSSVTDSIIAKAKAEQAYQNPQSVNHNLNKQHDAITIMASEIGKKQRRLQELSAEKTIL